MNSPDTRELIQDAVLELMQDTQANRISVVSVIRIANISRSTFYGYYDSVQSVIEDIQETFFREFDDYIRDYMDIPFDDSYFSSPNPSMTAALLYFSKRKRLISTMLSATGYCPNFGLRCRLFIKEGFYERALKERYIKEPDTLGMIYLVGGHFDVFIYCATNDLSMSVEDQAITIYKLMFGPYRPRLVGPAK